MTATRTTSHDANTDETGEAVRAGIRLVWLDPRTLTDSPDSRDDLGDLTGLTASIAEIGVLQPLTVTPTDEDGHEVTAGRRRRAAAIAAGLDTVPCIVRPDRSALTDQLVTALTENLRRQNLTMIEEARGYQQLAMAGMSMTKIAKATGSKRGHVKASLAVADSDIATAVARRYDLSLDQALIIAEFSDDTEAVKLLTVTAERQPDQWDHVLARLRADRQDEAAQAAKVAELSAAGVRVIDESELSDDAARLDWLTDDDGNPLDPEAHAACPGHAVIVYDEDDIDVYCLDPTAAGHREHTTTLDLADPDPTPMSEQAKADRRETVAGNKAWRAAEKVRRDWLRTLLTRKTAPKGTLRYVTEAIVARPDLVGKGTEELVADLLGVTVEHTPTYDPNRQAAPQAAAEATDARLPLVLLAQVAADIEARMDVHTWRHPDPDAARWLAWLGDIGYTLSDIETSVITETDTER